MRQKNRQAGQAATEFLVAAVFLLVPLFLIIPLLGKYIDMKHAAIGQARYSAWENMVWRVNDTGLLFGDPHDENYGKPGAATGLNPLWKDHRGTPLFRTDDISASLHDRPAPPPGVMGKIFEGLLEFFGDLFGLIKKLLGKMHVNAGFDVLSKGRLGYYTTEVNLTVRRLDDVLPPSTALSHTGEQDSTLSKNQKHLVIRAKGAVLTNNWNAGGTDNANAESRGLVITSLLSPLTSRVNALIRPMNSGLSHIPGFDIKLPGLPDFGHVQDDLIPYEHLYGNTMKIKDKRGLSSYENP